MSTEFTSSKSISEDDFIDNNEQYIIDSLGVTAPKHILRLLCQFLHRLLYPSSKVDNLACYAAHFSIQPITSLCPESIAYVLASMWRFLYNTPQHSANSNPREAVGFVADVVINNKYFNGTNPYERLRRIATAYVAHLMKVRKLPKMWAVSLQSKGAQTFEAAVEFSKRYKDECRSLIFAEIAARDVIEENFYKQYPYFFNTASWATSTTPFVPTAPIPFRPAPAKRVCFVEARRSPVSGGTGSVNLEEKSNSEGSTDEDEVLGECPVEMFLTAKDRGARRRITESTHPTRGKRVRAKELFQLQDELEIISSHDSESESWIGEHDWEDLDFKWSDEADAAEAEDEEKVELAPWIVEAGHAHNEKNVGHNFRDVFPNNLVLVHKDDNDYRNINARGLKLRGHRRSRPKGSSRTIHHFVADFYPAGHPLRARFCRHEKKQKDSRVINEELRRSRTNRIRGGNPVFWGRYFKRQGERLPLWTFRSKLPWLSNQL